MGAAARGPTPGRIEDGGRREQAWFVGCLLVLVSLAAVTALGWTVLVSTLGVVVVVAGLVLPPRLTAAVAVVAVGLATALVLVGTVPENGGLRIANVVVGSALGLAASVSRSVRTRQIRRLQRRDAALLAGLPDAVVGLDAGGTVISANPAAQALLGPGAPLQELAGREGGAGEELLLADGRTARVDWTAVRLGDGGRAGELAVVLLLRDAEPRLAALRQAAQLAESRREAALQRHYLDVLERALRPPLPPVPGYDLGSAYVSAEEGAPAGGDLHDAVVLADGRLYLFVLDALGHGVASTRVALRLVHGARALVTDGVGIGDLAARLDAGVDRPVMASLVAALLDPATGRFEVAAAGHPPPLLVRADGSGHWVESTGRGVGAPKAGTDQVATGRLERSDTLLLYTDGIVEAHRDIVADMDRLPRVVGPLRTRSATEIAERTAGTMLDGAVRRDDALVVAVRRC
jgi:serine phosphatase RsbU (regulator of sigma subunit)